MERYPRPIVRRLAPLALILLAAALAPAAAMERGGYSVEILVDGTPLEEFAARGTTYIEALEGREYSVRLRNRTGRRVAVALSVDGLNSIDAKTTSAREAAKWILGPYETVTLDGWQTSGDTARRFFFTTERKSYGAWLGKTDNLGIVSAAFFRERRPEPAPYSRLEEQRRRPSALADEDAAGRAEGSRMKAAGDAPSVAPEPSDEHAATGIGRRVDHRVRRVHFDAEDRPAAVMQLRYEYHDALVRLGVRHGHDDALARRERARGFEDLEFAPDPFDR